MPERGGKPGFYVVVSRPFIAENEDLSAVVCAPLYREHLGLSTGDYIRECRRIEGSTRAHFAFFCGLM